MQQPTTFQQLQNRRVPKTLKSELKRTALLEQIQELGEYRLTALIAPSGYGKTTVLGQYARLASRPIIWINLGDDNVDQIVLGQSMLKALLQLIPTLETEVDLETNLSPGHLASILEQATENLSFIIEGIEVLGSEAGQWLRTFVNLLPEGHHVFVSGFENTGLPLARMIADGLARLIGPDELAFTLEESTSYFKIRNCTSAVKETHNALEGWPAGLALVASGASVGLGPTDLVLEVMQTLPDDVRQHLPEAAVFNVWIEHDAKDLGLNLPSGWLQHVRRVGLPITPLGSGTYRPHRVLLEALEIQLRLDPDRHAQLHGLVAQKREQSGQVLEALRYYQLAGNIAQALRLASQLVRHYELRSEFHLIERILGSFHEGQLSPQFKALLGRVWINAGHILRAEALLQDLVNTGQAKADALFGLGVAAFVRTQHHKANGYFDQALACADHEALSINIQRIRVGLLIELQRLPEALEQSQKLVQIAETTNDTLLLSRGLASVMAVLGAQRAFDQAIQVGHKALRVYETLGMPVASMVLLHNFANALLARGQLEQAQIMIERGIKIGIENGMEDMSRLYGYRALTAMIQGNFSGACETYHHALNMCGSSQDDMTAQDIRLHLWDAALHAGHTAMAAHSRQRAREVAPAQDTDDYQMYMFCEGLQAFVDGDLMQADHHLSQCDQTGNDFWVDGRSRAFRAEIARREHRLEQKHVQYLLAGLEGFCDDLLRIDANLLAGLYTDCVQRNWWPERFAPLAAHGENLHTKLESSSRLLELRLITLGEIKFLLAGTPVHIPLTKAGELLVWLAMNGPGTREQIMDALWEGSNEQRHLEYFKISVRRMRAALSEQPAVTDFNPLPFENGKYRLSERFTVQLDAIAAAQALASRDVPTMQQALELQVGEFMPGSELEWASEQRQRRLVEALELAMTLGSQLEETAIVEAQQVYQRAIALDRLHEPSHLALIRAYQRAGDLPGARRAYASYSRMLTEEFDSKPNMDLQQILQFHLQSSEHHAKPRDLNG